MAELMVCNRCVLPESKPDIFLSEQGVCNVCVQHDATQTAAPTRPNLETDFLRLIEKHRGKGEYDCLVMCSGGKDSTAALYYMKKRYRLRPLAFTFDHGFETEEAMENIRRAVEVLDVDYLTFRSTFMKDMFRRILETGSKAVLCHLCSIWYMNLTFGLAARFKIPIIIAGWTKGQSTDQEVMSKCACNVDAPEFAAMARATKEFLATLDDDPKYRGFPRSMEDVLKRAKKRFKTIVLSPHWFLPYEADEYVETIKRELGWEYPELSYPGKSTNCALNFISVHNSVKNFGYSHYHVEMSKQIRQGIMTRDEALELLKLDFDEELLNKIAEPLGYTFN
jgi:Queuosine biosynthesis protein QueC